MLLGPAVDAEEAEVYLGASRLSNDSSTGAGRLAGGCGVFWGDTDSRNISERCPEPCRTYGEALLHALRHFLEEIGAKTNCNDADSIRKFTVVTSSVCLIMTFAHWYTPFFTDVNGEYIQAYRMPVVRYIYALLDNAKRCQVKIEFLLVHKGETYGGEKADRLAEGGAEITDSIPEEQDWASIETAVRKRLGCAPSQWPRVVEILFPNLDKEAQARIRSRRVLAAEYSELLSTSKPVTSDRKRKRFESEDVSDEDARPCKTVKLEEEFVTPLNDDGHPAEAIQSETKDITVFDENSQAATDTGHELEDDPFDSDSDIDGPVLQPEPYPDVQLPEPVEPAIATSQESITTAVASSQAPSDYDESQILDAADVNEPPPPAPTKDNPQWRLLNIQKGVMLGYLNSPDAPTLQLRKRAQPFPMMTPKQETMHLEAQSAARPPPVPLFGPKGLEEQRGPVVEANKPSVGHAVGKGADIDVTIEELEEWESMSDFDI